LELGVQSGRKNQPACFAIACIVILLYISLKYCDCCILQLTRIDSQYFLESLHESVVFVNNVRVKFKMLNNLARITLGGVIKSHQQGSMFPAAHLAGAHVIYEYHNAKDYSLATGLYQEPMFGHDELITFDESVGGRLVKEVYHTEDFNMTLVLAAL